MRETTDTTNFIEMLSFPYYAHLQAQLATPAHSISWNQVALIGYIDILLYAKDQIPPAGFQRKIRILYENYQNLSKNYPILGDLDGLFRGLNRLDKDQTEQVTSVALQWYNTVQVIEKICLELTAHHHNFSDLSQLTEILQRSLYQMQLTATLPKLSDFLDAKQDEIVHLAQLKQYPTTIFQKNKLRHLFSGTYHTDKEAIQSLFEKEPELDDLVNNINRTFFRLVNAINQKLPEPDRSLKANQSNQDLSTPQDYRLVINLSYNGNEENEYESGVFTKLRNLLRII